MSAETASSIDPVEVFVPLLDEGTDALRPTRGIVVGPDAVQLLPTPGYDPEDETWAFPPGSRVRCVTERRDGRDLLVARSSL